MRLRRFPGQLGAALRTFATKPPAPPPTGPPQRALNAARAGRFDVLLVYRVDRFARSIRGLATSWPASTTPGSRFARATEPFDTTTPPDG